MTARRVAVTGAGGQLGGELVRAFSAAGDEVLALSRDDLDMTRPSDLTRLVAWHPHVVVNTAAWTDVDGCARDPDRATLINGTGAGEVSRAAAAAGAVIVQLSTNEVFDGTSTRPYREDDAPNPINPYGASKLLGELAVAGGNARHLIIRTAWLFGIGDRTFPVRIQAVAERMLAAGMPLRVVADEWGNPTDVRWLAPALIRLLDMALADTAKFSVYHMVGEPPTTRLGWARAILRDSSVAIEPIGLNDYRRASRVPARAILETRRIQSLGIAPGAWDGDHGPSS